MSVKAFRGRPLKRSFKDTGQAYCRAGRHRGARFIAAAKNRVERDPVLFTRPRRLGWDAGGKRLATTLSSILPGPLAPAGTEKRGPRGATQPGRSTARRGLAGVALRAPAVRLGRTRRRGWGAPDGRATWSGHTARSKKNAEGTAL